MTTTHTISAPGEAAGSRLDRFLAGEVADVSRSRLTALIKGGHVTLDGAAVSNPSAKVVGGATYVLTIPPAEAAIPEPEDIPIDVLYEDEHLIVVNKAAGMPVHPAMGHWSGTLVHALLHHCRGSLSGIGGVERPGIVHRIDKDTSGVLVVAKNDIAHQGLAAQFADHSAQRRYIAFVRFAPDPRTGRIETRLARSNNDRKKMAVVRDVRSSAGRDAITNYETLAMFGHETGAAIGIPMASKVECRLETGRTHQIRVHMAHIGCPMLGDPVYGRARTQPFLQTDDTHVFRDFKRQALHAASLGFVHPVTGEDMMFQTDLPADMAGLEDFLKTL
tara:strand:+ start:1660 stop:2658 length:999 start_codon:yes stop_codon:yes gene_type:complete